MRSSIRIHDCLSCMREVEGMQEQRAALREHILREIQREILKLKKVHGDRQGKIFVRLLPRRFQLYGELKVFTESVEGGYRLDLPMESWAVSDRNLSRNEFSVMIE